MPLLSAALNVSHLSFHNKGTTVASTNFWQTELARVGFVALSFHAGVARLFIPESGRHWTPAMQSADRVIMTVGAWLRQEMAARVAWVDEAGPCGLLILSQDQICGGSEIEADSRILVQAYVRGADGGPTLVGQWPCIVRVTSRLEDVG
jgi:hypothetical protein